MTDDQAVQYALVENLQREDLNPVEETEGLLNLLALRLECDTAEVTSLLYRMENEAKGKITRNVSGNSEASTVEQVFASLGRINWQSFVRTRLPLLKLPDDILEALRSGQLEYTKAKEIAKLKSESERQELLEDAIASSLSLSQIRERIKTSQPPLERGEFAARIDATTKRVKKSKVWENPSKRQRLEFLLKQLEELISSEEDKLQPIEEAEATQDEPQPTAKSSEDSSPIESGLDPKESQTGVTEEFSSDLSQLSPETAEVPDNRETPSSESLDESRPDAKEEQTQLDSESTNELLSRPLTHAEMAKRLGIKSSTLSDAKKKPNFSEWSKSKDPDAISWQWVAESKRFVSVK
jgi:ParB-like chromosome segregation protein Spo0J